MEHQLPLSHSLNAFICSERSAKDAARVITPKMHCLETIFWIILFQELFDDDQVANTLESLAGTLKAAKKKAVVSYGPELLLQVTSTSWNFMFPNDTFSGYE